MNKEIAKARRNFFCLAFTRFVDSKNYILIIIFNKHYSRRRMDANQMRHLIQVASAEDCRLFEM